MVASNPSNEDVPKPLGLMETALAVSPDALAEATALIEELEVALHRTISASGACPYCQVPTYLRRHHPGCGVQKALADARAWKERQA